MEASHQGIGMVRARRQECRKHLRQGSHLDYHETGLDAGRSAITRSSGVIAAARGSLRTSALEQP